jgi:hypothetical protein
LYTKAGIIHGDVSFNNFLFDEDEGTAANPRQAWLVDLDNASIETPKKPSPRPDPDLIVKRRVNNVCEVSICILFCAHWH